MKTVTGKCKFCGQTAVLEVPDKYGQTLIDEEATKRCKCDEAVAAVRIENDITYATADIKKFFEDKDGLETFKKLLLDAVRPIAQGDIEKISMTRGEYSVAMKKAKEGIDVRITHKTVEVM